MSCSWYQTVYTPPHWLLLSSDMHWSFLRIFSWLDSLATGMILLPASCSLIFTHFLLQTRHIANSSTAFPSASSPTFEGCYANSLATKLALSQEDRSLGSWLTQVPGVIEALFVPQCCCRWYYEHLIFFFPQCCCRWYYEHLIFGAGRCVVGADESRHIYSYCYGAVTPALQQWCRRAICPCWVLIRMDFVPPWFVLLLPPGGFTSSCCWS